MLFSNLVMYFIILATADGECALAERSHHIWPLAEPDRATRSNTTPCLGTDVESLAPNLPTSVPAHTSRIV